MKVLIVDDHAPARRAIARCLKPLPHLEIFEAASLNAARQLLERQHTDVALIDLRLDEDNPTDRGGLVLVRELRESGAAVPIVVTSSSEMGEIRSAMRAGAYAYILKDELSEELVLPVLTELQHRRSLEGEVLELHGLVGRSPSMERLRQVIKKVAAVDAPVLIQGPTGSGKELVARAIHALSPRRSEPLATVNCGALSESLVEAQLFGYSKGAFTGADRTHPGYFAESGRGTLFLDEIAELPAEVQTKLLRVVENRTYRALGSASDCRFEGRLLAATHVDLAQRIAANRFRADLYYRLEILTIRVPSLDERKEDIPVLVDHFAKDTLQRVRFSEAALEALTRWDWPGNVRQLRNLVHRLAVFVDHDFVTERDIAEHRSAVSGEPIQPPAPAVNASPASSSELLHGLSPAQARTDNIRFLERNQVRILESEGRDSDEICRIMDISRSTLFRIKRTS